MAENLPGSVHRRMDRLEQKIDDLATTTNTMKGAIDTWKWIVPVAVLAAGVIGALLAAVARLAAL